MNDRPRGPLTPGEERELMQRLALGDDEAIRVVYDRFARPVYTLVLRMLRSPQIAEELTQDVFVAAWRKSAAYDPTRGRLSTWLMTIAHNTAVDRIRREAVRLNHSALPLEDAADRGVHEDDGALDRVMAARFLSALAPGERRLLELAYFRGWTAREIAERDGIPLGTVKTRIRATLIKLRREHKPEEA